MRKILFSLILLSGIFLCTNGSHPLIMWSPNDYGPNFQQKEDDSQINPQIFEEKIKELQLLEKETLFSLFILGGLTTQNFAKLAKSNPRALEYIKDAVFESKSAALYPETDITFTELLTCLDRAGISEVKSFTIAQYEDIHSIHHNIHTMETNPNLIMFIFDHDLHPIHFGRIIRELDDIMNEVSKGKHTSMFLGVRENEATGRFLEEEEEVGLDPSDVVKSYNGRMSPMAIAGLLVSFFALAIAMVGFLFLMNIQTPTSFAKQNLVLGKVQE